MRKQLSAFCAAAITGFAVFMGGCQGTTSNNTTTNQAQAMNTNPSPAVNTTNTAASQNIEVNEPNQYRAVMELRAETKGENAAGIPPLTANIARSGNNRRVSFNLPNNNEVVYLNQGNTRYLILPNRKQYAELTNQSVGFQIPQLMMPDQIINYLRGRQGFERVGEEQLNGRQVIKYRAAGTTQTNSQAGQVQAETFTFVDKETGLPVRTEFASQAAGNVQGVQGVNAVVEMRDIKTETDASLFEVPQGYSKISEEQVRSQINLLTQAATAIAGTFLNSMNNPQATTSPTP